MGADGVIRALFDALDKVEEFWVYSNLRDQPARSWALVNITSLVMYVSHLLVMGYHEPVDVIEEILSDCLIVLQVGYGRQNLVEGNSNEVFGKDSSWLEGEADIFSGDTFIRQHVLHQPSTVPPRAEKDRLAKEEVIVLERPGLLYPRPLGQGWSRERPGVSRRETTPGHPGVHQGVAIVLGEIYRETGATAVRRKDKIDWFLAGLHMKALIRGGIEYGHKGPPAIIELLVGRRLQFVAGLAEGLGFGFRGISRLLGVMVVL